MADLLEAALREALSASAPLAARCRPRGLEEFVGQEHLLGPGRVLSGLVQSGRPFSALFAGPPGTGKTSLARLVAEGSGARFVPLNAVVHKVADLRSELEAARRELAAHGRATVLFVDEVHRFNRAQQEVLLPGLEEGIVHLLATTTENPNAALAASLLSRLPIFTFRLLSVTEVRRILEAASARTGEGGKKALVIPEAALERLARGVSGDARSALNLLDSAARIGGELTPERVDELLALTYREYDRDGDQHFDTISAFIKSVRGSDPDAALYWLARMLSGGEDPRFVMRRLLILACEDVGNADPQGLVVASSGMTALEQVGMPEGRLVLAQVTTYLASAPKSNASYLAMGLAEEAVGKSPRWGVPGHLKNRPRPDEAGAGSYRYPHDEADGFVAQTYLPRPIRLYRPKAIGAEAAIRERLLAWDRRRREAGLAVPDPLEP